MKLQLKHNMNVSTHSLNNLTLHVLVNMLIMPRLLRVGVNLEPLSDVYDRCGTEICVTSFIIEIYVKKL